MQRRVRFRDGGINIVCPGKIYLDQADMRCPLELPKWLYIGRNFTFRGIILVLPEMI